MLSLSLSLRTLPRFGLLTYVKLPSLLYYKWRRMTLAGNSLASSAPLQSFLPNYSYLYPPFITIFAIFSGRLALVLPASPLCVTLNVLTFLVSLQASPAPFPLCPSFPQSPKHCLFPLSIYSHPTLPFLRGPTHALLYNPKTVIPTYTKTTPSPSSPPPPPPSNSSSPPPLFTPLTPPSPPSPSFNTTPS